VNVLSNPLLTTVSGKEAKLEVIEKVPYIEATQQISTDGGAAQSSSEEIAFADVGVRLTVTPEVGGDDIVEMKVKPEVLELVDFVLGTPVIDERIVETTVYVRNNETIVLAGLLREGLTTTTDKVPFLGDIPLLDALFRREEERTEKRELLIFLTPHLIGPGAAPHKGFQPQQYLLDQMRMFPEVNKVLTKKSLGR
jgi:type II secretory pathway component GspD/PulD (secretin)